MGAASIADVVLHPTARDVVFARSTLSGAFRLGPDGWTPILTAASLPGATPADAAVESLAVDPMQPSTLYLAVGADTAAAPAAGRLLKSADHGRSFRAVGAPLFVNAEEAWARGSRLAVSPRDSNVVIYGSRRDGLLVTRDGGATWASAPGLPRGGGVTCVVFDPRAASDRVYAAVAGVGVFVGDSSGSFVLVRQTDLVATDAQVLADGRLFVAFEKAGGAGSIWRLDPATMTWTDLTPDAPWSRWVFAVDPFDPDRMMVAGAAVSDWNVWRTVDGGRTWKQLQLALSSPQVPWILNTNERDLMPAAAFRFDPVVRDRLWFAETTGVWRSNDLSDDQITFELLNGGPGGIEGQLVFDLSPRPGGGVVSAVAARSGFAHVDPDAYPDRPLGPRTLSTGTSVDVCPADPRFIAALTSGDLYNTDTSGHSDDGGATWTPFATLPPDARGGNIAVSATDANNLVWLPANGGAPFFTRDRGTTWSRAVVPAGDGAFHNNRYWTRRALAADAVLEGTFYLHAATGAGVFLRSTDGGQTWILGSGTAPLRSASSASQVFGQLRAVPGVASAVWASLDTDGLWYTRDGGGFWQRVDAFARTRALGFGAAARGHSHPVIYVDGIAKEETGIWRSIDGGASWQLIATRAGDRLGEVTAVAGDLTVPGRVYVAAHAMGVLCGDDVSLR